ncbi:hypothetical protein ADIWIN_1610 [Winogradskyella psychrotolerans RS-3]|uniref:DUF4252 domain-containing protein n=1 Tax=Winogradskyella psychrotolerans RS-3 TaxID=641526 RepID=S7VTK4_9FLAO|nr:DUF4252 domain-containing protein [Winogradskyella psychrotolerans]EPR73580.1 hypothetical protein ADIWIN_1610 [Winogradskyella psychrotolerans RS-3]
MKNYNKYLNMGKTTILIVALMLTSMVSFGQNAIDKLEDKENVTSFILNQKMFRMLATMGMNVEDSKDKEYVNMVNNITGLKVFTAGDEVTSKDITNTVTNYIKSSKLDELMRFKDGDKNVKFYVKEGKDENHVKELVMFMTGMNELVDGEDIKINGKDFKFETIVISLTGEIDLRQVSKITSKMDIPGGDQLKKAGEKKQ